MSGLKISQLTALESLEGNENIPVEKEGQNYKFATNLLATKESFDQLNETVTNQGNEIENLQSEVDKLKYGVSYAVSGYTEGDLDPTPGISMGDTSILAWDFFLIDCTQNTGQTITPVGKLKRNNLLRFEDNTFAPTVGITEEMRAYCDAALYLNNDGSYTQYCAAGEFNAENFYNEYGIDTPLYTQDEGGSSYTEVPHILRPWETTETKYTIVLGRQNKLYLIDQIKGNSGTIWKGIFTDTTVWDGIDVSKYELVPTGISPCPITTVNGAARSFFYLYEGETNCKSSAGQDGLCTMFLNGRTYPRNTDVSQNTIRTYARANNSVSTNSYPFAEGGYLALNTFITCQEILYKTKYLHNNNLFGSGISSNDSSNNETNWTNNGGIRYKLTSGSDWSYATWSTQGDIYYNATGSRTNFNILLALENPKEQCMESQMAASFAVETGVAQNTDFEFYGSTYRYVNILGANGLADGEMNCKIFKVMSQTFDAYDSAGIQQSWDVEVNLRMSLINGMNVSGDIFAYWGGGVEVVGTCEQLQETSREGNTVEFYVQNDQIQWHNDNTVSVTEGNAFTWEESYEKIGTATQVGNGYSIKRQSQVPYSIEQGGSLSTGECFYGYQDNYWGNVIGSRFRIGLRSRGYASYASCSPRNLSAYYLASYTARNSCGSAQVLLNEVTLQAE